MICASWRAVLVQPEDGGRAAEPGALHGEFDPILDRRVLHLAHAEDIAILDRLFEQHLAGRIDRAHHAVAGDFEGLVVRAVFLGLLRHQADIGHAAHGRRIVGAVLLAVLDDGLIDARIAAVGDQRLGVLRLAVRIPHLAAFADHGRHGGIDDHVAGHVQVGDALVGVHHREVRPRVACLDIGFNVRTLLPPALWRVSRTGRQGRYWG